MVLRIFVQGCSPHSNRCLEPEKGRLFRGWTKRYPPGRPRSSCVKELCLDGDSSILSSTGDDVKIGAKLASVWLQVILGEATSDPLQLETLFTLWGDDPLVELMLFCSFAWLQCTPNIAQ